MFGQRITGQCARILTFVVAVQYAQDRNARGARPARRWSSRRPSMSGLALLATMRRRIARVADPACAAFTSLLQRSVMIKETLHRGSMRRLVEFGPGPPFSWFDQHRCAPAALNDARERLQSALDEAIQHGYQGVAYEIRLALGELDMRAGKTAAARAGLAALEDEARGRGFGLIARK